MRVSHEHGNLFFEEDDSYASSETFTRIHIDSGMTQMEMIDDLSLMKENTT